MTGGTSGDIGGRINALLQERQRMAGALASIDQTLSRIHEALGIAGPAAPKRRGRPPLNRPAMPVFGTSASAGAAAAPAAPARRGRRGRRGRGNFSTTAEEMILTLVGQSGGATTKQIKEKWKGEGRGGTADNALSKLVRERKLKRSPIEGERGSIYHAA